MISLVKKFHAVIVGLSAISLLSSSAIWAKTPAGGSSHVVSQPRISSMGSAPTTIYSSNGLASDKISNSSLNSAISGNSPSGGGHPHTSSASSSSIGSSVSKVSGSSSPRDSNVIPAGGGSVKGVTNVHTAQVMDFWTDLGGVIDDVFGVDHGPWKGTNNNTSPTSPPPQPSAPGSSSLASIANNKAKFVNQASYLKNSPMTSTAGNYAATKWNATHIAGQVAKGDATNSDIAKLHQSPIVIPPKPQPIPQPKQFPQPMPYPTGSVFGGGYSDDSSIAISTTDGPTTDATTASATTAIDDIDLVLEDVKLAAPATLVAGPAYTVTFRNQGSAEAGKFQVAILASLNSKLDKEAPQAVAEVASMAGGEVKEVTLRLPQKALKLPAPNGKTFAFSHLIVAVDLMNTVAETDKTNNTAVVERAALETLTAN